jgi:hypothetical protein
VFRTVFLIFIFAFLLPQRAIESANAKIDQLQQQNLDLQVQLYEAKSVVERPFAFEPVREALQRLANKSKSLEESRMQLSALAHAQTDIIVAHTRDTSMALQRLTQTFNKQVHSFRLSHSLTLNSLRFLFRSRLMR